MFRVNLSDSILQTVFIPGAIFLIAIGCLFVPYIWTPLTSSTIVTQISQGGGIPTAALLALAGLAAYLLAMFLGLLLAVGVGYLEYHLLDRRQARRLDVSYEDYQRHWTTYVDSLEFAHNSYVTKQVAAFQFEARAGLAFVALSLCILPSSIGAPHVWGASLVSLVLGIVLLLASRDDHYMLAQFRKQRFGIKPDPTATPEDALAVLIDRWCKRGDTASLRFVLPLLSLDRKTIPEAAKVRDALLMLLSFPDAKISPSEKHELSLIVAALTERARVEGRSTCCDDQPVERSI